METEEEAINCILYLELMFWNVQIVCLEFPILLIVYNRWHLKDNYHNPRVTIINLCQELTFWMDRQFNTQSEPK